MRVCHALPDHQRFRGNYNLLVLSVGFMNPPPLSQQKGICTPVLFDRWYALVYIINNINTEVPNLLNLPLKLPAHQAHAKPAVKFVYTGTQTGA